MMVYSSMSGIVLVGFGIFRSHWKCIRICNPYSFGYVWMFLVNLYDKVVFGDIPSGINICLW